eukprot:6201471-Pleurochrysis_carterae.AAC.3
MPHTLPSARVLILTTFEPYHKKACARRQDMMCHLALSKGYTRAAHLVREGGAGDEREVDRR